MAKKKPSWIKDKEVRKKLPKGRTLPAKFDAFIVAEPDWKVEWNDLEGYNLKPTAQQQALAFLRTYSGGVIALWYHADEPAVVLFGDEGGYQVLATNFDEFLKGLAVQKSGYDDADDAEQPFVVPGVKGKPSQTGIASLQKKLDAWRRQHSTQQEWKTDSEDLRGRVQAVVLQMMAGGISKHNPPGTEFWRMKFRIEKKRTGWALKLNETVAGKPVPEKYQFLPLVEELLKLVNDPTKDEYEMLVSDGMITINNGKELTIMTAELAARLKAFEEKVKKNKRK